MIENPWTVREPAADAPAPTRPARAALVLVDDRAGTARRPREADVVPPYPFVGRALLVGLLLGVVVAVVLVGWVRTGSAAADVLVPSAGGLVMAAAVLVRNLVPVRYRPAGEAATAAAFVASTGAATVTASGGVAAGWAVLLGVGTAVGAGSTLWAHQALARDRSRARALGDGAVRTDVRVVRVEGTRGAPGRVTVVADDGSGRRWRTPLPEDWRQLVRPGHPAGVWTGGDDPGSAVVSLPREAR